MEHDGRDNKVRLTDQPTINLTTFVVIASTFN